MRPITLYPGGIVHIEVTLVGQTLCGEGLTGVQAVVDDPDDGNHWPCPHCRDAMYRLTKLIQEATQ